MRLGRSAASGLTCVVVVILVVGSCALEPSGDRSADPSLSRTSKATSTSNADRKGTLKAPFQMSSTSSVPVADSQLHVIFRYPPLSDPNLLASPLAVTSVGKLIAYEAPLPDGEKLKHGLVVVTGESGRVTRELPERNTVRQVVVATSFGESVVWRETASTSLDYEDYQISAMTAGGHRKLSQIRQTSLLQVWCCRRRPTLSGIWLQMVTPSFSHPVSRLNQAHASLAPRSEPYRLQEAPTLRGPWSRPITSSRSSRGRRLWQSAQPGRWLLPHSHCRWPSSEKASRLVPVTCSPSTDRRQSEMRVARPTT